MTTLADAIAEDIPRASVKGAPWSPTRDQEVAPSNRAHRGNEDSGRHSNENEQGHNQASWPESCCSLTRIISHFCQNHAAKATVELDIVFFTQEVDREITFPCTHSLCDVPFTPRGSTRQQAHPNWHYSQGEGLPCTLKTDSPSWDTENSTLLLADVLQARFLADLSCVFAVGLRDSSDAAC